MVNLAAVALRAVVDALAEDEEGARAALVALLAPPVPAPAPVAHRDLKPANVRARSSRRRREPEPDAEVVELLEQLVAQHGSQRAVARAAGLAFKQVNTWMKGRAHPTVANLRKLRALVDQDDEAERVQEPEQERTEAQALVVELVERFGDVEAAAASTGIGLTHLRAWEGGGPCSPRALGRLREAAHAPIGRADPRGRVRREATPAAAPDEAAAGEDDAAAEEAA